MGQINLLKGEHWEIGIKIVHIIMTKKKKIKKKKTKIKKN
jgi:hypothetical protein